MSDKETVTMHVTVRDHGWMNTPDHNINNTASNTTIIIIKLILILILILTITCFQSGDKTTSDHGGLNLLRS
jgi:hypothetical protein